MIRIVAALLALCVAVPLEAATYRYVGGDYGRPSRQVPSGVIVTGERLITITATRIDIFVKLDADLLPNKRYYIDDAFGPSAFFANSAPDAQTYDGYVETDANAKITNWSLFSILGNYGDEDGYEAVTRPGGDFVGWSYEVIVGYSFDPCGDGLFEDGLYLCYGAWDISAKAPAGTWTLVDVPLPASALLLLGGLGSLLAFRRRV